MAVGRAAQSEGVAWKLGARGLDHLGNAVASFASHQWIDIASVGRPALAQQRAAALTVLLVPSGNNCLGSGIGMSSVGGTLHRETRNGPLMWLFAAGVAG